MAESRSQSRLSVIVPALNEGEAIADCLSQFDERPEVEVVVADGGSRDATRERVKAWGRAVWVDAPCRGRGRQLNAGARASRGEVLLFLHADCRLPAGGLDLSAEATDDPHVVGGRFRLALSERTFPFPWIAAMSTWRSRRLGITYGDQGIFARRSAFEAVGGFPPRRIFEDSEFCSALRGRGRFVLLDAAVTTSTRRWREWGIWRTVLWMWTLRLLYTVGVPDERLARWYRSRRERIAAEAEGPPA